VRRLVVENVGPIRFAELELPRVSVVVGGNGSGKTTLAMIHYLTLFQEAPEVAKEDMVTLEVGEGYVEVDLREHLDVVVFRSWGLGMSRLVGGVINLMYSRYEKFKKWMQLGWPAGWSATALGGAGWLRRVGVAGCRGASGVFGGGSGAWGFVVAYICVWCFYCEAVGCGERGSC